MNFNEINITKEETLKGLRKFVFPKGDMKLYYYNEGYEERELRELELYFLKRYHFNNHYETLQHLKLYSVLNFNLKERKKNKKIKIIKS